MLQTCSSSGSAQTCSIYVFIHFLKTGASKAATTHNISRKQTGSRILCFFSAAANTSSNDIFTIFLAGWLDDCQIPKLFACNTSAFATIEPNIREAHIVQIAGNPLVIIQFRTGCISTIFQKLSPFNPSYFCNVPISWKPIKQKTCNTFIITN